MSAGRLHITDAEAANVIYAAGLDPQLEARVRSHRAECVECATKLDSLRAADRSAGALLMLLDVPAPKKTAAGLVQKAKVAGRISLGSPRRVAAGIVALMVIAGAAAAAIPSSPLHRLIVAALGGKPNTPVINGPASRVPAPDAPSGVSINPPRALEIVFKSQNAGVVHLHITDGYQVALTSSDVAATYRVGSSRIIVSQSAPADFYLDIPRGLAQLRVLAGDKVVFSRSPGARMATDTLTINLSAKP